MPQTRYIVAVYKDNATPERYNATNPLLYIILQQGKRIFIFEIKVCRGGGGGIKS
jgi:hypothetical protein